MVCRATRIRRPKQRGRTGNWNHTTEASQDLRLICAPSTGPAEPQEVLTRALTRAQPRPTGAHRMQTSPTQTYILAQAQAICGGEESVTGKRGCVSGQLSHRQSCPEKGILEQDRVPEDQL